MMNGQYLTLEKIDTPKAKGLKVTLTPEGREAFELGDHDDETRFFDLFDEFLGNGWSVIVPEEVGALTEGLMLSPDATYDDDGNLTSAKTIYWDSDYQLRTISERLLSEDGWFMMLS